jgi:hypothetical protein
MGGKLSKPTVRSAPDPFVAKCQALYNSILISEEVSDMGDDDVDDTQPMIKRCFFYETFMKKIVCMLR